MHGFGGIGFTWFFLIIVIILGLVWIMKDKSSAQSENSALDIAKNRLARGEITMDEFEAIKEKLKEK